MLLSDPIVSSSSISGTAVDLPLIVVVGPTAVGKTEISIQLSERLKGEIISADSRLFYRGMDIGTAKPSKADRDRVPHHLIDITDPVHPWSLALYQSQVHETITAVYARGHLPFLVGGTGQYIRAVVQSWRPPQVEPDHRLRLVLEAWAKEIGGYAFHQRLAILDPESAANIDPRNLRRSVRALEVILSSGRLFSQQRRAGKSPYRLLQIGLNRPRDVLYARIDQRIEQMLLAGLVDEVRYLLSQYPSDCPAFSAIGYRQMIDFLHGSITLPEAIAQIRRATRIFVRRQANWFKDDDPDIHWFTVGPQTVDELQALIRKWLASES